VEVAILGGAESNYHKPIEMTLLMLWVTLYAMAHYFMIHVTSYIIR